MFFPCRWFTQTLGILIMLIGTESLWQQSQLLQRQRKGEINKTPKKRELFLDCHFQIYVYFHHVIEDFFIRQDHRQPFSSGNWHGEIHFPVSLSKHYVMIQTIKFFFPCRCFTQTFGILTIFIGAESPYQPSRILQTEQKGKINKIQLGFFFKFIVQIYLFVNILGCFYRFLCLTGSKTKSLRWQLMS